MAFAFERCYPLLGGLIVAAVYLLVPSLRTYVLPDTLPLLLSAVVTVAAIAVGFLATAKSILIASDDRPIIKRIKDAGLYRRILRYFRAAIFWSFLLSILSAAALLFNYNGLTAWDWPRSLGTAAWLWVATAAMLSYHRIAGIWYTTLDSLDTTQP